MGHISVYRRMLVWAIGTVMILVGVIDFLTVHEMILIDLFLFIGGWAVVIINETVFSVRRTQLEMDRDETLKTVNTSGGKNSNSPILAICPECRNRIPSESKYCPECGSDLQIQQTCT